jgi:hypothetical protein
LESARLYLVDRECILLGAIAWPKPGEPQWHVAALIVGMATSVLGMGFRYLAHIHQKKEISQAKAKQGR